MLERSLISGANGFIGKALCQDLRSRSIEVYKIPRALLFNQKELKKLIDEVKPDYIYHLAAYGNKYDQKDDLRIIQVNLSSLINLLYATKDLPYKAFINFGSSSEYGEKRMPMRESDSLDTDTFYGATKAASTLICKAFAKKHNKPIITIRPFSVYGAGDDPKKFISTAINCLKTARKLNLASGVHDWIHISDFLSGVRTAVANIASLKGQVVNIGTGIQYSNMAVISILKEIASLPINIRKVDKLRDYDTGCWKADSALLRSFGWQPETDLEKGLARLYYER